MSRVSFFPLALALALFCCTALAQNEPAPFGEKSCNSAELFTHRRFVFGRIETLFKAAPNNGAITLFCFLGDGDPNTFQKVEFELLGRADRANSLNSDFITGTKSNMQFHGQLMQPNYKEASSRWVKLAIEKTPTYLKWYVDDRLVRTATVQQYPVIGQMTSPSTNLRLSLWASDGRMATEAGQLYLDQMPATAEFDYIRYYSYDGNTDRFSNTPAWADEFNGNSVDTNNWGLATYTFTPNACVFSPRNAQVGGGRLVITMTRLNAPVPPIGTTSTTTTATTTRTPTTATATTRASTTTRAVTGTTTTAGQSVMPYNLEGCYWDRYEVISDPYVGKRTANTYKECQRLCAADYTCGHFVWGDWKGCYLKGKRNVRLVDQRQNKGRFVSGPARCPTTSTK
eukprot:GDKI01020898.1.p1 GENE.GDKI01020898.1~~GDKI01020898.1.p1  ORF type:complete len:425 (+),score=119.22 GDKI01020898.1:79-1275(+)